MSDPISVHHGVPVAHAVLGAVLHLEILSPEDEARLDRVNDLVWSFIGPELRHSWLSCVDGVKPARRADLDYIPTYVQDLDLPDVEGNLETKLTAANFAKIGRTDYSVALKGGATWAESSPFSYQFWAEIPGVDATPFLRAGAVIALTMPIDSPLDDFVRNVCAIASTLRLRWGAAGYTYATWLANDWKTSSGSIYAHARRYPGYDVGFFHRLVEDFYDQLRTVNWLTFLGPGMIEKLSGAGGELTSTQLVAVHPMGDAALLYAGARPEAGDHNRLYYPRAYVEADAMVRPIRARSAEDMVFLGPWTTPQIEAWLCRFERRLS